MKILKASFNIRKLEMQLLVEHYSELIKNRTPSACGLVISMEHAGHTAFLLQTEKKLFCNWNFMLFEALWIKP
jgi:hypothetical protein